MNWIMSYWTDILEIVAGIIAVASVIVKITPSPKDNEILKKIMAFLGLLALTPKERKK